MRKYINTILSVVFLASLSACASKQKIKDSYDKGHRAGYAQADGECIKLQKKIEKYLKKLQNELQIKEGRLRRFNQLNEDDSLRNSKKFDELFDK